MIDTLMRNRPHADIDSKQTWPCAVPAMARYWNDGAAHMERYVLENMTMLPLEALVAVRPLHDMLMMVWLHGQKDISQDDFYTLCLDAIEDVHRHGWHRQQHAESTTLIDLSGDLSSFIVERYREGNHPWNRHSRDERDQMLTVSGLLATIEEWCE